MRHRLAALVALVQMLAGRPGQRIYIAATDQEQAALVLDSMRGYIRRAPVLAQRLRVLRSEIVHEAADSVVTVLAADAASSWGLRPSLLVVDELSQWRTPAHEEFFWSLWSSLGKVEGARIIVALTAHWDRNGLAWKARSQVKDDPAWHFSVRGQCASWVKPEFLEEQRRLLPDHLFRMLHLNEWTETGAEFLTFEEIEGVFDPALTPRTEPVPGRRCWFGLDLATTTDRTALAVVHEDGALAIVDAIATWAGTPRERVNLAEVEETLVSLAGRFRPEAVVMDPYQGLLLADRLRNRGITVEEFAFTAQSRAALFDVLLQLLRQKRLRSFPHAGLREELTGPRWVEKAGVLRPDHPATGHDDIVVAVALAARRVIEAAQFEVHLY